MTGRREAWITLLLLSIGLAACGGGAGDVGPLGGGGGDSRLCTPVPGSGQVVFGNEVLRNGGDSAVRIRRLDLVEPEGVTLAEAALVPLQGSTLLGTTAHPPASGAWRARKEAVGATLEPGETWNLALTLDRSRPRASFSDVVVTYDAGGEDYRYRLAHALLVVASPPCPP